MFGDAGSAEGADAHHSLAWRCRRCGRLHLVDEPAPSPRACADCGARRFEAAGPGLRRSRRYAQDGLAALSELDEG